MKRGRPQDVKATRQLRKTPWRSPVLNPRFLEGKCRVRFGSDSHLERCCLLLTRLSHSDPPWQPPPPPARLYPPGATGTAGGGHQDRAGAGTPVHGGTEKSHVKTGGLDENLPESHVHAHKRCLLLKWGGQSQRRDTASSRKGNDRNIHSSAWSC